MELFAVTIDAPDAAALAHFYADLLELEVTYDGPGGRARRRRTRRR